MRSVTVDGNNILDVYLTVRKLAEELRENPEPVFVQCKTFRMRLTDTRALRHQIRTRLLDYWVPATRSGIMKIPLQEGLLDEKQAK